eukprot:749017-Hanusia_phi.AAC.5
MLVLLSSYLKLTEQDASRARFAASTFPASAACSRAFPDMANTVFDSQQSRRYEAGGRARRARQAAGANLRAGRRTARSPGHCGSGAGSDPGPGARFNGVFTSGVKSTVRAPGRAVLPGAHAAGRAAGRSSRVVNETESLKIQWPDN